MGVNAAILTACSPTSSERARLRTQERTSGRSLAAAILPGFQDQDAEFLWRVCNDSLPAADASLIQAGLIGVDQVCQELLGAPFERLTHADRSWIAALLDTDTFASEAPGDDVIAARRFFELFKALVIVARFTSQQASETCLHYDPVPGGYFPDTLVDADFRVDLFDRGSVYLLPALRWELP